MANVNNMTKYEEHKAYEQQVRDFMKELCEQTQIPIEEAIEVTSSSIQANVLGKYRCYANFKPGSDFSDKYGLLKDTVKFINEKLGVEAVALFSAHESHGENTQFSLWLRPDKIRAAHDLIVPAHAAAAAQQHKSSKAAPN